MKISELQELMLKRQEGTLNEKEVDMLKEELRNSAEARRAFVQDEWLQGQLVDCKLSHRMNHLKTFNFNRALGSCMGYAAVFILSCIATSIFWHQQATPKMDFKKGQVIFEDSFEKINISEHESEIQRPLVWCGDEVMLSAGSEKVQPRSGKQMLELKSTSFKGDSSIRSYAADQLILIPLNEEIQHKIKNQKLMVSVNAYVHVGKQQRERGATLGLQLFAFNDNPIEVYKNMDRKEWLRDQNLASTGKQRTMEFKENEQWSKTECEMQLPSKAKYLILNVRVLQLDKNSRSQKINFNEVFVDDIQVLLNE
jgi:hypothetical protein